MGFLMVNKLDEICVRKREHVNERKRIMPISELETQIKSIEPPRDFTAALAHHHTHQTTGLIAEIKKASPSRGLIREDFNPSDHARDYQLGGACCLSVLTDTPYFQGQDDYIHAVKQAGSLPVLRKDFMIDPYQIYESRALGADCVLLIVAALDDILMRELYDIATNLGMAVLVETHDRVEMERALSTPANLIGINNRNLKTLEIDFQNSLELRSMIPDDRIPICESGIYAHHDIQKMQDHGFYCFLVGESLMRQDDLRLATQSLLSA